MGENILINLGGIEKKLPHRAVVNVQPGDTIIVKTPGGGGVGKAKQ